MSYWEALNHFLETYATKDVIAELEADMMQFIQASNELSIKLSEAQGDKDLR